MPRIGYRRPPLLRARVRASQHLRLLHSCGLICGIAIGACTSLRQGYRSMQHRSGCRAFSVAVQHQVHDGQGQGEPRRSGVADLALVDSRLKPDVSEDPAHSIFVAGVALVAFGALVARARPLTVPVRHLKSPSRAWTGPSDFLQDLKDSFQQIITLCVDAVKTVVVVAPEEHRSSRLIVNSSGQLGKPLCGEYQKQSFQVNNHCVYSRVGPAANSQAIYLLYNNSQQWAFTPHKDGRLDSWAFVTSTATHPSEIKDAFSIWDGNAWTRDPSLHVWTFAKPAVPDSVDPVEASALQSDPVHQQSAGRMKLPSDAESLSLLHWKAHWHASERCLVKWPQPTRGLVEVPLPTHPGIRRGVLPNGLRYVLLRNAMPPQRFEAHIELHVGSIDEEPHEQGLAHMMEHVCFLGSRKREQLFGTGSRSNALTDFQHTIYHIHAPVKLEDGRGMYLPALEALHEVAFAPEMFPYRIEKERKAVLAEMQQVNDMEYRIETWTLSGLHETNRLGTQFPIGKEEQIKSWQQQDLRSFHQRWYYPGNATLYVVGDLEEDEMVKGIRKVFEPAVSQSESPSDILGPVWGSGSADPRSLFRRKISKPRPEQLHNFSSPMIGTTDVFTDAAAFDISKGGQPWHGPLRIFRNELLEGLQINLYAKTPARPLRTLEDIRHLIAMRILLGVLQFRVVSRYSSNHAPVQIDHSDSFREGCAVTSITVNATPHDWKTALTLVVQEVRALCDFGVTEGEMRRYMDAMLKDAKKGVTENDAVPSEDHLNFIMNSDVFDHVVMHPEQSYEAFRQVAPFVTMEQVHMVAKWMLGFVAYYGKAAAAPPTAIVVCTPTQTYEEHSGRWLTFQIAEEEVIDVLVSVPDKPRQEALNQVEVPESLLKSQLELLLGLQPVDALTTWRANSRKTDSATGIVQLMLPNGARVNYTCTSTESQGTMRLLLPGGRSVDKPGKLGASMVGVRTISESGAVSNFSREQIELFAVSNSLSVHLDLNLEFSYVDASFSLGDNGLIAVLELLHLLFQEPRWEMPAFVRAQQAYKAQASAVRKSLEQSTLDRLMRMMYGADGRVCEPRADVLNELTLAKVREAVAAHWRPQDLEINLVANFTGKGRHQGGSAAGALSTARHRDDGDFEEGDKDVLAQAAGERRLRELDEALWTYLGLIPPSQAPLAEICAPVITRGEDLDLQDRQRSAHLEDSDERAIANIGGSAPNRWGRGDAYHTEVMAKRLFSWDAPNSKLKDHPLYPSMCLLALREVISSRLFSTVRDSLGLSYDCSFELSMLDLLETGWFKCTVSAHPSRIMEAVNAAKGVLQGAQKRPISEFELSTARRTLVRRHETDLQKNEYWISLLSHLQCANPKDITCIRDIEIVIQGLTWHDVQNAYKSLLTDDSQLFISISTAGPGASYVSGGATRAAVSTSAAPSKLVEAN